MRLMLIAALAMSLPACTFVHMAPKAGEVKVLATAPSCEKRGEAEVSVRHKVGFYERSEAQVRDELETLARNEAPGVGADAISPLGPPVDGGQRWALWRCER
ncbi:MAG TPA: DUF4156 domain-containing protein [Thermomonas sp.]|nr:DUF4156 domain-containing protein [Thermomonas sp.]